MLATYGRLLLVCSAALGSALTYPVADPTQRAADSSQQLTFGQPYRNKRTTYKKMGCCSCLCGCIGKTIKLILYILALPALLIISAVGFVIWLFLKIVGCICPCCCACTCALECAENILEGMVKLPFKAMLWVGDECGGGGHDSKV